MGEEVDKCYGKGHRIGFAMSCSVCLEAVVEDAAERSIAKLKCGHHFHLDCIGSAFNAKGRMQCPNCRQVEHGQWLFASGCYLQHEDFVDDFTFEEEVEALGGTTNLHYTTAPWCPHQSSIAQFSLTFEEPDNIANGYVDPVINLRSGLRVPTSAGAGQVCPYLAAQGLSTGGSSQEFLGLHVGHHRPSSRSIRRAASFHRSFGQPQTLATSSNSTPSFERSSQSYNHVGGLLQSSSSTRQHALGFLVGSPQSVHTGQGMGMGSRPIISQPPHVRSSQSITAVSRSQSVNATQGSGGTWRPRHHELPPTPQRTSQQGPTTEVAWTMTSEPVHEFTPLVASSIGQGSNPVVLGGELGWAPTTENQVDGWAVGVFVPQPSMGSSSQWWAWVPSGSTHGNHQRLVPPTNSYQQHESQFLGAGMFPARPSATPLVGFSEQPAEGPYAAWGFTGFQ